MPATVEIARRGRRVKGVCPSKRPLARRRSTSRRSSLSRAFSRIWGLAFTAVPERKSNFLVVCSERVSGQYQYDQKYMSGVFTNSTHALTLETEQSIKAKMCGIKAEKAHYLTIDYGMFVFDIDADMEDRSCAKVEYTGRYKRLKLLKRINDFMKGYKAKNMKQACESL